MNLRETIRNLSKEDKQAVYATLTRNERLHAVAQNSDSTIYAYEIQPMSIIYFRDDKWVNYVSFEVIGNAALATDHATTILKREEVFELLKVEEYKLDNLPKNGWYVELPENKDDIDLDKLNKALNKEYEFYHENGVDKICKYYGVISDTCLRCTDYFEYVEHLENVTHLFLKQPEYTLDNLPEKWFVEMGDDVDRELLAKKLNCESIGGLYHYYGISKYRKWSNSAECFDDCVDVTHLFKKKEEKMETIEINGKKYRKIDTGGSFEERDEVLLPDNKIGLVIGYDDNKLVVKVDHKYIACGIALLKLEEIRTRTLYYAFYKLGIDVHITKLYLSESKIREDIDNILEIRTFEQEL